MAPIPTPTPTADLIAAHGGRVTRTRVAVLDVLRASGHSLNHDEIAAALAARDMPHDRVTVYRILDWLVENDLAHRVIGADRARRYRAGNNAGGEHAHFHCNRCGHVVCLESVLPDENFALPEGFRTERAELVFHGTCADCGRTRA